MLSIFLIGEQFLFSSSLPPKYSDGRSLEDNFLLGRNVSFDDDVASLMNVDSTSIELLFATSDIIDFAQHVR